MAKEPVIKGPIDGRGRAERMSGMQPLVGGLRGVLTGREKAGDGTLKGNEKPFVEKARELEKAAKKGRTS